MECLSATYCLICNYEFYHVAHRHILHEKSTLAGQGWLVFDLCCKEKKRNNSNGLHLDPLVKPGHTLCV